MVRVGVRMAAHVWILSMRSGVSADQDSLVSCGWG